MQKLLVLYFILTEHLGIPVSTTHTITGSIIGVGLTKRVSAGKMGLPSVYFGLG